MQPAPFWSGGVATILMHKSVKRHKSEKSCLLNVKNRRQQVWEMQQVEVDCGEMQLEL